MADSKRGKKAPEKSGKTAEAVSESTTGKSTTLDLARKLALAVIREHGPEEARQLAQDIIEEYGLPEEIRGELLEAGVPSAVINRIGGAYDDHPHGAYGYKRKGNKKK